MSGTSIDPTVGSPKNPVPLLEQRIELLEGEVQTLHKKLLAARRELALVRGGDPQQALDELLAEFERMEKLRLQQEKERLEQQDTKESPQPKESKPPKGHGPREQPNLAVIEETSELDLDACPCPQCGGRLEPMGAQCEEAEEITILERRYVKKVLKRRKYRCRCNGHIQTAPGIVRLIPGGRYSLDFAIHVAVAKYLDHLPLERQRRIMARGGLEISSPTLWDQIEALARIVGPTYEALGEQVLRAPLLHADETRWPLLNGKTKKGSWTIWTRSTPEIAHYTILSSKSAKAGRRLFSGFDGIVVVDGYAVYTKLAGETAARDGPKMHLVNCWAHVLRKFTDIEDNFPAACQRIIQLISDLYEIEARVPGPFPGNEAAQSLRLRLRQEESKPLLEEIHAWAHNEIGLPRSALGRAVKYMLKRWKALTRFVDNPLIPLDNNAAERALRGPVVGRKNHYGSKSRRGTQVAAIFYTLLETAKLAGIEPAYYLKTVAERALQKPGTVTLPQQLLSTES